MSFGFGQVDRFLISFQNNLLSLFGGSRIFDNDSALLRLFDEWQGSLLGGELLSGPLGDLRGLEQRLCDVGTHI